MTLVHIIGIFQAKLLAKFIKAQKSIELFSTEATKKVIQYFENYDIFNNLQLSILL